MTGENGVSSGFEIPGCGGGANAWPVRGLMDSICAAGADPASSEEAHDGESTDTVEAGVEAGVEMPFSGLFPRMTMDSPEVCPSA